MIVNICAPDPLSFPSGGNRYNHALSAALADHACGGVIFQPESLSQQSGSADHILIDSLYFYDGLDNATIGKNAVGLIHYLRSSLDPIFTNVERKVIDLMRSIVVTSPLTRNQLRDMGYETKNILVLEPATGPLPERTAVSTSKLRAIMVSNLVPVKGVHEFLQSLARLNIPPHYELQIVGSLTMDHEYARLCQDTVASDANLSRTVHFMGAQDAESTSKLVRSSNLFVSASQFESFGIAIQEGRMAGLPLLVTNAGHSAHHVTAGENGKVVPDVPELAKEFEQLYRNPELHGEMYRSAMSSPLPTETTWYDQVHRLRAFLKDEGCH